MVSHCRARFTAAWLSVVSRVQNPVQGSIVDPVRMHCGRCRRVNSAGGRFCAYCGMPLAGAWQQLTPHRATRAPGSRNPRPSGLSKGLLVVVMAGPMLLTVVFLLIPFLFLGNPFAAGSATGEIRSQGSPHGDYVLGPTSCYSGEHEGFFGVWIAPELEEDAQGRSGFRGGLKLVKDPVGSWRVFLQSPAECESFACVTRPVARAHCGTFDVSVRHTNVWVNEIRERQGHADLECRFPEGGSLSAHLTFERCH